MIVCYDPGASGTVAFAAQELKAYLTEMLEELPGNDWKIELRTDQNWKPGPENRNDAFRVRILEEGGSITGCNDRSVLLGVYDYLHRLGCRFLIPGKKGERIPSIRKEALPAEYEKQASFYHRGVCIEGADSIENVKDFIDWLPKVGYNSFFLQFKVPYAFFARWYFHEKNPFAKAERFSFGDAVRYMKEAEAEIQKRGLLLHKVGHGWTGEVLGYETSSWNPADAPANAQTLQYAAELGGVRGLYQGVPANTNLCYHSGEAVDKFASLVVQYVRENPQVDYLHIWLADEYNNVCECEACRKTTVSDQYVQLLNEIDARLTAEKLDTRLVFLLYQELLWPPIRERLVNPDRFVLMFAPISRTFEASYMLDQIPRKLPEYVRNHIVLPSSLGENLAYLREWQKQFRGDGFVYDYPLGRAHYGDFGYVQIARVISEDIKKLSALRLDGYISCQELRAALPNALPNYVMGYTLFCQDADIEAVIDEYFEAAYGSEAEKTKAYLEGLSRLGSCDYINGKGQRKNASMAERMETVLAWCKEAWPQPEACREARNREGKAEEPVRALCRRLLAYHRGYIIHLAEAVRELALGNQETALEKWAGMRDYLCDGETDFQPYLDVYRVLEVTEKYTGFR